MGAIKMGGIVSGMDTNAIVDELVSATKAPIDRLNQKLEVKALEKTIYSDVNEKLGTLETDLLTLRLESTFKTKNVNSSNSSLLYATATTEASPGTHVVNVEQTAKNSSWVSSYTRQRVAETGAGVAGLSGVPDDNIEGLHQVEISDKGTHFLSTNTFKPDNWGTMTKSNGAVLAGTVVDASGDLQADYTDATLTMDFSDGTDTYSVTSTFTAATGDDINTVTRQIEEDINSQLNTAMGTNAKQYYAVRADYDDAAGEWNISFYEPATSNLDMSVTGGTAQADLGLGAGFDSTGSATNIMKYHRAADAASLHTKMDDAVGGLIPGATLKLYASEIEEGTFSVKQDASLKVAGDTYSEVFGADGVSTTAPLDTYVTGLNNAGFDNTVDDSANGYFTINGIQIEVEDYTKISVDELLAKINSSGAGVTANYESAQDRIVLTNNEKGPKNIDLGTSSDTSNLLDVMKLTYNEGGVKALGSTEGSIDPTAPLSESGMSAVPNSGIFTVNGVSIYVDSKNDSLNDVMQKVNNSGAGVTMSYDTSTDKVNIVSDSKDKISFGSASDTSGFLQAVNLTTNTTVEQSLGTEGRSAVIEVDGVTYVRDSNNVDDIIPGVELDIRGTDGTPITLTIETDTDRTIKAVASFVQHYNELMQKLNVPDVSDDDRDEYMRTLSDEEKNSMSDTEYKEWMEKFYEVNEYDIISKSSELRNLHQSVRAELFYEIPGLNSTFSNLQELGIEIAGDGDIETESLGYLIKDTTDYDEIVAALEGNTDFLNALRNQPADVYNFFAEDGGWTNEYEDMIERYTENDGMIQTKVKADGSLDREMQRLSEQIERLQDRAEMELERYWKQFTAMEKAIADAEAQGNALTQALSGAG
ncbi:flagellar filament capping protein FliD [Limisalsivibrio acetivorans]|uniref:flagellar filament capping protein FliD n=1 Tax=Limisalsivibrio acetivorans TaxID=1304888 RepID=UPI0003B3A046|nr:flagellar filament capping protein FliD [Limisalsivibrio acetivorans]